MIKEVFLFTNGMVMVFDDVGQQMSEYQGKFSEVKQKILDNSNINPRNPTRFYICRWKHWQNEFTREEFASL